MSRFLDGGASWSCARCNQPFPQVENRIEAYRGKDNRYYCDALCADEADQPPAIPRLRVVQ